MDDELFAELLASAKEAVAISRGEADPSRVFHVDYMDAREIRERAGLSPGNLDATAISHESVRVDCAAK